MFTAIYVEDELHVRGELAEPFRTMLDGFVTVEGVPSEGSNTAGASGDARQSVPKVGHELTQRSTPRCGIEDCHESTNLRSVTEAQV